MCVLQFEDYIQARFFDPLEIKHSSFYQDLPPELSHNVVTVYRYNENDGAYVPSPWLYVHTPPTGGLSATAPTWLTFIALLGKGRYGDVQILSAASAQAMLDQQFEPHPGLPGVTFGFMEHSYNGQRGLMRDGSGLGIRSQVSCCRNTTWVTSNPRPA